MSAALHHVRLPVRPTAEARDFPVLRLDDFSSRLLTGDVVVPDAEALLRARAEGHAEGAALAHDRQVDALTLALRQQAEAMALAVASHDRRARDTKVEIAQLLRSVAGALLPLGRDAMLVEALVAALDDIDSAAPSRARIACPAHLHDNIRAACKAAGLAAPDLTEAPEPALQLDDSLSRIDLSAMQDRLMRLIDDYATGDI